MIRTLMLAMVAAAAPVSPVWAQAAPAQDASAATSAATPSGAKVIVPADWRAATVDGGVTLTAPEGDLVMSVIDVTAADGDAAVAAAWAKRVPGFARKLEVKTPETAKDGWEERHQYFYVVSPNEKRLVAAFAMRAGTQWTVLLLDGSEATYGKRSAAAREISSGLTPKGYVAESFAGKKAHKLDAARIDALKAFLTDSMAKLQIPGVGFALIQDGKIIHEGGLGVRAVGSPEPVDAHTLFMIASNTKSMSTLLLAKLVDEGKLRWDQPVIEADPRFRLGNDATTKAVQVRHLVCACTGLPRQDMVWIANWSDKTPASAVYTSLAGMQPTSGFGEVYQYSNMLAAAAGYVGAHIAHPEMETGAAYDRAMQELVFGPLGMRDTTFDFGKAMAGNHAMPYDRDITNRVAPTDWGFNLSVVPARPAGGAWSSAHDMILYVQNELTQGVGPDGKRHFGAANLLERRKPFVKSGESTMYGMGLETDTAGGVTVVRHGGSMAGFKSDMYFLPELGVGAVLLTNSDSGGQLLNPFKRRLLELLYDGKPEAATDVATRAAKLDTYYLADAKLITLPADPAAVAKLAPRYTHPLLGSLSVVRQGDKLFFDFGAWKSLMGTRANPDGTMSIVTISPSAQGMPFVVGADADGPTLTVREAQSEYVYKAVK